MTLDPDIQIPILSEPDKDGMQTLLGYEPGYHVNIALQDLTPELEAFRVFPSQLRRVFAAGTSPHLLAASNNTYDIGAVGGTRPRTVYAGTSMIAPYVATTATTVTALPAAATAGAGARAFVTDANATTFLSTVAAGGANAVPVVSNGTNWLIG